MKLDSTNIQGNAAISRNVTAGGNVDVKGDVTVGHHLRVKGWVDAPHIKGPLKGLYGSEEALNAAYPRPRAGWYALVGDTLPADVWRAEAEKGVYRWVPTGEQGGETTLWLDEIENDIRGLGDDVRGLKDMTADGVIKGDSIEFTATAEEVEMHYRVKKDDGSEEEKSAPLPNADGSRAGMMTPEDKRGIAEASTKAEAAQATAQAAQATAQAAQGAAENCSRAVTALAGKVGAAGGIAPLGGDGKVPAAFLPDEVLGGSGGDVIVVEPVAISDTEIDAMFRAVDLGNVEKPGSGDLELNPLG